MHIKQYQLSPSVSHTFHVLSFDTEAILKKKKIAQS